MPAIEKYDFGLVVASASQYEKAKLGPETPLLSRKEVAQRLIDGEKLQTTLGIVEVKPGDGRKDALQKVLLERDEDLSLVESLVE